MSPRLQPSRFAARTLPALLVRTSEQRGNATFLRFIPPTAAHAVREVTFAGFAAGVARAVRYLRSCGVRAGDRVLLLAENTPEWQMIALAAQCLKAEPAALFASLGARPVQEIARRVRPRVLLVSTAAQWEKLRPIAPELVAAGLSAVISEEDVSAAMPEGLRRDGTADVFSGSAPAPDAPDVAALEELRALAAAVTEEDPFLLLFTSGTTGRAKGVRLPQRAIVHAIDAGAASVGTGETDVGLHLLPFGHVAGHDQFALALAQGHTLLMIAGRNELERALALSPTYLFSVPLIYERIRDGVEQKLSSLPGPVRKLARAALAAAARVRVDGSRAAGDRLLTRVADLLVGRAVRKKLGGRIRGLFAGGAPTPPALFRFFESLGLPYVELYGMSETAGMISSNLFAGPRRAGSVGLVSSDHDLRLGEGGELQLRGPLMLSGFLEPEDEADAFTPDGYFRTGDLARLDEAGMLHVTGRRKSILVLSTGKKISPEPIEQALVCEPPITGAMLMGEDRPFVTATVFVDKDWLARCESEGRTPETELVELSRARLGTFSDYERPKRVAILPGTPMDYPELVTPTLKLKRDAVLSHLGVRFTALYAPAATASSR